MVLMGGLGHGLDVSQALVGPSSVVQMSRRGREEGRELRRSGCAESVRPAGFLPFYI